MDESLPLIGARHAGHAMPRMGSSRLVVGLLLAVSAAALAGIATLAHQQSQLLAEVRAVATHRSYQPPQPPQQLLPLEPREYAASGGVNVLIVYANGTHLPQLAAAVQQGAERVLVADGGRVRLRTIEQASFREDVLWADAVILGSHVVNANVEPKMAAFFETWSLAEDMSSKVGAAFVTGGGISSGEELTMVNLLHSLLVFRFVVVGGEHWTSAFGASAVVGEGPFEPLAKTRPSHRDFPANCYPADPGVVHALFKDKAVGLGERVASVASRLAA